MTVEMFGSHTVKAVSRAEFDPVRAAGLHLSSPAVAASVTAATRALDRAAVTYRVHPYRVEGEAPTYGEMVASRLGGRARVGSSRRWWRWSTGRRWWRSSRSTASSI